MKFSDFFKTLPDLIVFIGIMAGLARNIKKNREKNEEDGQEFKLKDIFNIEEDENQNEEKVKTLEEIIEQRIEARKRIKEEAKKQIKLDQVSKVKEEDKKKLPKVETKKPDYFEDRPIIVNKKVETKKEEFSFTEDDILKGFIFSEILGEPKCKR